MLDTNTFIAELSTLSIIRLSGEQRFEYLHGQLTVATNKSIPTRARLSAHCDFKGKMFSAPLLTEYKDAFLLACQHESAQHSLSQLKKYGVFSKVDIQIAEDITSVGVVGDENILCLKALFPKLTNEHLHVCSSEFGQTVCFNDSSLRYLSHLNSEGMKRLHDISNINTFAPANAFEALEIDAGIANIQEATAAQFVPQMLNLHCLNAIDFDKGCYMGQEVVARTKFLGKNKRATFIIKGNADSSVSMLAGDLIELKIGDNWRRGGTILRSAVTETAGSTEIKALAVMANDTEVGSVVRLKDTNTEMVVMPLPYSIKE